MPDYSPEMAFERHVDSFPPPRSMCSGSCELGEGLFTLQFLLANGLWEHLARDSKKALRLCCKSLELDIMDSAKQCGLDCTRTPGNEEASLLRRLAPRMQGIKTVILKSMPALRALVADADRDERVLDAQEEDGFMPRGRGERTRESCMQAP
jgi:hypothetical protein